jgi:hypothetical protein
MLFATALYLTLFCSACCFQYRKPAKQEIPIEYQVFTPDAWDELLNYMESETEANLTDTTETEEEFTEPEIDLINPFDEVEEVTTELTADEVSNPIESQPVQCLGLLDMTLEDLIDVARSNGLKVTTRWKRATLISRLDSLLAA